ncbi:MAG: flavodoxin family protein [Bacteroidales bacterium]|nr:flavodoxin family protein [Bacteroidales bacterium]
MKVLIINGSPKREGNTAIALREVEKTLNEEGVETEMFHVGNKPIHGCMACNRCWSIGECVITDDMVNEIAEKMNEADGLLVGTPVYFSSPSGQLIALLDRLFYSNLHADWAMKVGAGVAVARRGGTTATFDVLNKYFLKTNMPVVPSQYWNIAHGCEPGDVVRDEEGMQTMRQLARNMAFMIKSIRLGREKYGVPVEEERVETHFIR